MNSQLGNLLGGVFAPLGIGHAQQNAMEQMRQSQLHMNALSQLVQQQYNTFRVFPGMTLFPYGGLQNAYKPVEYTREDYIRWELERFQLLNDKRFLKLRPYPVDVNITKNPNYSIEREAWLREYDRRFLLRPMG